MAPRHQQEWEELGELDPLWAVVSDPRRRYGGWESHEFFETGEREVVRFMARADELGLPRDRGSALDFGCGVGRVSRPLTARFEHVVGADVSRPMLERARELNVDVGNLELVRTGEDLSALRGRSFDLVYSRHVLQHLPSAEVALSYIGELTRLVAPGGLLLAHVPTQLALRHRLQPARRAYAALRRLGMPPRILYRSMRLQPIRMIAVPQTDVERVVVAAGGRIVAVDHEPSAHAMVKTTFYATPS